MKTSPKGANKPKPNNPSSSLKELKSKNIKDSIKYSAPPVAVIGGFVSQAFKERDPVKKLTNKAEKQGDKAAKKEVRSNRLAGRAEEIANTRPNKAARLNKRSATLKDKSARLYAESSANKKVAQEIEKIRNKK